MPKLRIAAFVCLMLPAAGFPQESCEPEADLVIDAACLEVHAADEPHGLYALLAAAQRTWLEYRDANCALFGYRTNDTVMHEAQAQCLAFMTRERELELELLKHLLESEGDHDDGC